MGRIPCRSLIEIQLGDAPFIVRSDRCAVGSVGHLLKLYWFMEWLTGTVHHVGCQTPADSQSRLVTPRARDYWVIELYSPALKTQHSLDIPNFLPTSGSTGRHSLLFSFFKTIYCLHSGLLWIILNEGIILYSGLTPNSKSTEKAKKRHGGRNNDWLKNRSCEMR